MRYIIIFAIFSLYFLCARAQYSKYYGSYVVDDEETRDCENLATYCCLGGTFTVTPTSVFNRLSINGTYSEHSYPNCLVNSRSFTWVAEVYSVPNRQFRIVSGLSRDLGTVDIYFVSDDADSTVFFVQGFGSFNANFGK